MNRVQRTALLAFVLLLLMATVGWWLGGDQAQPDDAKPATVLLDVGALETVRLLAPEQRARYLDVDRFLAPPVRDPELGHGGRAPGGAIPTESDLKGNTSAVVPASASYRIVRVHQGETLGGIARRELGSLSRWRELLAWNGLSDERKIYVGQALRVYDIEPNEVDVLASAKQSVKELDPDARRHTVQSGEFLGGISMQYYGTAREVDRILNANDNLDPNRLKPGQILIIPEIH